MHDLFLTFRGLRRSPGLTFAIVVTLGLGVGANAALFTALDRVFFQAPAGVHDPGAVRRLYARIFNQDGPQYGPTGRINPFLTTKDYLALESAVQGVARITGDYLDRGERLQPGGERVRTTWITPGYFEFLGVRAARGRFFTPDELRVPGAAVPVVVICRTGNRSGTATRFLLNQGFVSVRNLVGGMNEWVEKVDSSMEKY